MAEMVFTGCVRSELRVCIILELIVVLDVVLAKELLLLLFLR